MGPRRAAALFRALPDVASAARIEAELFGSLSATGKGHLTDRAVMDTFSGIPLQILWRGDSLLPLHPNGMRFTAFDPSGNIISRKEYYSIGGGLLMDENGTEIDRQEGVYPHETISGMMEFCRRNGIELWGYILKHEGVGTWSFLEEIWEAMEGSVRRGLSPAEKILPGSLALKRRSPEMMASANERVGVFRDQNLIAAYALAVAEENAAGGLVVTAPTCGSCGVLPSILHYFSAHYRFPRERIIEALGVAGLFGLSAAVRGSISGAEVGCQGEIGVACAMTAAAAMQIQGGTVEQVEYAAEMGMEHFLGLTCDPVAGLVQVPCIERNAFAAMRALECASFAMATDGRHMVGFDEVIAVMKETGKDLQVKYRETATGGLAEIIRRRMRIGGRPGAGAFTRPGDSSGPAAGPGM